MRVLITIEYLGTAYCGWQLQKNGISIQEKLTNALSELLNEDLTLHGSGRTDAGVHAICQTAHFDTLTKIPVEKIPFAVSRLLPQDISVTSAVVVASDFHARFDAISKTYLYKIYTAKHKSPLREFTHYHIPQKLAISKMRQGADLLVGEHDFKCFQKSGSSIKDTVRKINYITVDAIADEVHIEVNGNGFLHNMVRIIAGTLVYIGMGKLTLYDVKSALIAKDRTRVGKTLKAKGLYLKSVEYNG